MDAHIPASRATATAEHSRQVIARTREAAASLLLYQNTLRHPAGEAYLALLDALTDPGHGAVIRRHAAMLFRALTEAPLEDGTDDAWRGFLVGRILRDENTFSRSAQRLELSAIPEGIQRAARHDLVALGRLWETDGENLAELVRSAIGRTDWPNLRDLTGTGIPSDAAAWFGETPPEDWGNLLPRLASRYRERGVGPFAEHRAFRWTRRDSGGALTPVRHPDPITFDDLIGYAEQRRVVRRNTEHFLAGLPANNLLLYGERGTGKSSTVKALLNAYHDRGLRLVEVSKPALADFPEIVGLLADQPRKFVVFADDLSFDENEVGYTELKAILEGGLEVRPPNVLIYATSNRRHLILERFSDRALPSDEVRAQDTMQEKLSLADRFGVTVIFPSPDQTQYLEIVRGLTRQRGIEIESQRLDRLALQWASWNNGRSGRTARQFVDDLFAEKMT